MSHIGEFNRILDKLYKCRTDKLRRILSPKPGPSRSLTKRQRERKIRELQTLASKALANGLARREFDRAVSEPKTWRAKGWRREGKRKEFRKWIRREIHKTHAKVYVFWRGGECRYVARTRGKGTRPSHHFKRGWFNGTTRIDVYVTKERRSAPSVECLAIHRFRPTKNKIKAATENWTPKCPLCAVHKKIKTELRKIYRFG
jgi:hypothetical protein